MDRDLLVLEDTGAPELQFDADGQVELATEQSLVRQYVAQTLSADLGEWAFDQSFGLPYRRDILIKQPNLALIASRLRSTIAQVPHVNAIRRLDPTYDPTLRRLSASGALDTEYGIVEI